MLNVVEAMRPRIPSPWPPGSHLFVGCVDGMVKGELLYSLIKVEIDHSYSYKDGGISSMWKWMTQDDGGVWVPTGVLSMKFGQQSTEGYAHGSR